MNPDDSSEKDNNRCGTNETEEIVTTVVSRHLVGDSTAKVSRERVGSPLSPIADLTMVEELYDERADGPQKESENQPTESDDGLEVAKEAEVGSADESGDCEADGSQNPGRPSPLSGDTATDYPTGFAFERDGFVTQQVPGSSALIIE